MPSKRQHQLHVLHVIDRMGVGGMERMLVDLANQAVQDGLRVSVCITRAGGELSSELSEKIDVVELGRRRRWEMRALRNFGRYIREQNVDVLHVHGRSSFSFVALAKALGIVRTPALLHDHFSIEIDSSVPAWFRFAARFHLHEYVGVYEKLGSWARRAGVAADKIRVIGNAIDLRRLVVGAQNTRVADPHGEHPGLVGITVAGIRREKGTDVLLRAIAQLPSDLNFVLLIVGGSADPEYAQRCQDLSAELGIGKRVRFMGERRDAPALMSMADFAVMPSRSESGPLALIEYMAFGLPFVATRVGNISERAEQLGLTEFVQPNAPDALALALDRLLHLTNDERSARGATGRRVAEEHFDIVTVGQQWRALYQKMVGE